MADGSNHIDEYEELQDEHEALSLKPSERARFEERLKRSAKTMQLHGHLQAFAKLRPDDRALLERAVTYWGKVLDKDRRGEGVDPLVKKVWEAGQRKAAKKAARKRFASAAVDPARVTGIDEWHSAAEDAHTIFPKSVTAAWDTDRLLVSGHNNAKLGRAVERGEWAGMPIFHLTLEERATCPRSCEQFLTCYGNAMHLARRHDARSPNFLDFLRAELWLMARSFPKGFVVRLHTLGDFYSVEYVAFWRLMLEALPMLRAWGYTARREDDEVGAAVRELVETHWDRFAIRWSNTSGPQGTIVVDDPGEADHAILCPAQHTAADAEAKSDSCATCGLCWNTATRAKTIAFLRHGMKARGDGASE